MGGMIDDAMEQPPATMANDAADPVLFAKLKGWVRDGQRHKADWDKEAWQAFGLVAGDHFSDTVKDAMLADGRQPVTFNRVGPIIDAICGLEVNGRQEIKYRPRTQGDAVVNDNLTALAKWARDEAQAEDEESDAFRDAVISGLGFTETRMDYDVEPEGCIVIDRIDPLECGVDPAAKKPNAIDRRYTYRGRTVAGEVARGMFPGFTASDLHCAWFASAVTQDGGEGNKTDYPNETRAALRGDADRDLKEVTLVEIEWYETTDAVMIAAEGQDKPETIDAVDLEEATAKLDALGVQYQTARVRKRVYRRAMLGASAVIQQDERDGFQIHVITGKRDRNKGSWYGMGRAMRDPQLLANKVLGQVLHIINTNAKGGIMHEEGAFKNPRAAAKDWSNPAKSILLEQGGLAKIKERVAVTVSPGLVQVMQTAISAIPDVTGVNVEMMGLADRDQPASLEYQRRQSAVTILAPLFDALRRYRKEQGGTLLTLLRMLTPGTMVRITQDAQQQQAGMGHNGGPPMADEQYKPFNPADYGLDDDEVKYDIIVDQAPSAPSQKDATWATLTQLMTQGIQLSPAVMAELVQYSPLPKTVADKVGEALKGGGGPDPQVQQQMQEMHGQLQAAGKQIEAMKADRAEAAANMRLEEYRAETDRMKVIGLLGVKAVDGGLVSLPDVMEMAGDHMGEGIGAVDMLAPPQDAAQPPQQPQQPPMTMQPAQPVPDGPPAPPQPPMEANNVG